MYGQLTITHLFYAFFFFQKQTWTLKSDIISRVIYLQLTGGVSVGETTDRCFISVDEKKLQTDAEGHLSGEKYFMMI